MEREGGKGSKSWIDKMREERKGGMEEWREGITWR